jgi:hypothetical protein
MRIFSNSGATAKKQRLKEVSQVSSRRELEDNIRREKANLKGSSISDRAQVQKNLDMWQKTYDRTLPEKLTPQAKNQMWKRAKILKDQFTVGMLSTDELHPVKMFEDKGAIKTVVDGEKMKATNSVKRQYAWNKKNESYVREYKNIMRHLNPDDPNASDIEKFRPTGRIK